jgi:hypothetical protein
MVLLWMLQRVRRLRMRLTLCSSGTRLTLTYKSTRRYWVQQHRDSESRIPESLREGGRSVYHIDSAKATSGKIKV